MRMSGKCIREDNWDVENIDGLTWQERAVRGYRLSLVIVFCIVIQQILDHLSD